MFMAVIVIRPDMATVVSRTRLRPPVSLSDRQASPLVLPLPGALMYQVPQCG